MKMIEKAKQSAKEFNKCFHQQNKLRKEVILAAIELAKKYGYALSRSKKITFKKYKFAYFAFQLRKEKFAELEKYSILIFERAIEEFEKAIKLL